MIVVPEGSQTTPAGYLCSFWPVVLLLSSVLIGWVLVLFVPLRTHVGTHC